MFYEGKFLGALRRLRKVQNTLKTVNINIRKEYSKTSTKITKPLEQLNQDTAKVEEVIGDVKEALNSIGEHTEDLKKAGLKMDVDALRKQLEKAQAQVESLKKQLKEAASGDEALRKRISDLEEEIKSLLAKLRGMSGNEVEKLRTKISGLEEQLRTEEGLKKECDEELRTRTAELKDCQERERQLKEENDQLTQKNDRLTAENERLKQSSPAPQKDQPPPPPQKDPSPPPPQEVFDIEGLTEEVENGLIRNLEIETKQIEDVLNLCAQSSADKSWKKNSACLQVEMTGTHTDSSNVDGHIAKLCAIKDLRFKGDFGNKLKGYAKKECDALKERWNPHLLKFYGHDDNASADPQSFIYNYGGSEKLPKTENREEGEYGIWETRGVSKLTVDFVKKQRYLPFVRDHLKSEGHTVLQDDGEYLSDDNIPFVCREFGTPLAPDGAMTEFSSYRNCLRWRRGVIAFSHPHVEMHVGMDHNPPAKNRSGGFKDAERWKEFQQKFKVYFRDNFEGKLDKYWAGKIKDWKEEVKQWILDAVQASVSGGSSR